LLPAFATAGYVADDGVARDAQPVEHARGLRAFRGRR
jgi:hypothetical protein